MMKNLTSNQLILIALAAVLFLIAAFSFFLLQDPSAPLPFAQLAPTDTATIPLLALTIVSPPTDTPLPTRQTSYTPFAELLTPATSGTAESVTASPPPSETITPGSTTPSPQPTRSATTAPAPTSGLTGTPTATSITASPTITQTLGAGETGVTGRILQNGTPVANAVVEFEDDVAPRQSSTNASGHYWFTTLAPGTNFTLTFNQHDNPQMTPATDITSLAWIEGTLPTGVNTIDLPDFEVSINLNGMSFELTEPMDGAAYSASVISSSNRVPFAWTLYNLGGSYHVELGPHGSDQPVWTSSQLASTSFMWDGTLNDGSHISEGTYWWRVVVTKSLGNYVVNVCTQPWDILFNP